MKREQTGNKLISIGEYLRLRDEYQNLPGRITPKGEMLVLYKGQWMKQRDLRRHIKLPVMPRFGASMENPDRTKIWMYA